MVFLGATDVARISAICQVGADMLSKIGLNVDYISTDWGTVVQRISRKQPIAEGGWSIFGVMWGGYDWYSPAGRCGVARQRNEWVGRLARCAEDGGAARPVAARAGPGGAKALASDIQLQAFQDVPCVPLGLYYQPTAYQNDLVGMMKGLMLFTSVRRA